MTTKLINSNCNCGLCNEFNLKENIITTWKYWFLMFNRYPYLAGHVMLVPIRPITELSELTIEEQKELIECTIEIESKIKNALKLFNVTSLNIGINLGPHSGGSIPTHLHVHFVPRRLNDMNFMHTCGFSGFGERRDPKMYDGMYENARNLILTTFKE